MVACITLLYWENWSAAALVVCGGQVGGFVFFTLSGPFRVDLQKVF